MPISDSITAASNARYKHIYGQKFGRLLALEPLLKRRGSKGKQSVVWSCLCDCGKYHEASMGSLCSGNVRSCGCAGKEIHRQQMTTHGMARNPIYASEYNAWGNMTDRCRNPKNPTYPNYGGRGITVDPSWLGPTGFSTFFKDMGKRPPHTSLGRINNNGNYEPQNVRWETIDKQSVNKRSTRFLTVNGVTKALSEWSRETGIKWATLDGRIKRGYSPEKVITRPVRKGPIPWLD